MTFHKFNVSRSGYDTFSSYVSRAGYIEVNTINDQEKHVVKTWLRLVAWFWGDVLKLTSRRFQEICRQVCETSWNRVEQFEAKTSAFYFLFEKRSQKTFRGEGCRKCLESKSVLCFLLRHICRTFAVFKRNKVVLRRAVVNASLFVRLFNLFIFWMPYNKALNVSLRLGKHGDAGKQN